MDWILYIAGPMLMLFLIGSGYLVWYFFFRKKSKDIDNIKTLENLKKHVADGSISAEDAEVIEESLKF